MGDDLCIGVFAAGPLDALLGELDMDIAAALPEIHRSCGLLGNPRSEILVGDEENGAVMRRSIYYFNGVSARADNIGKGFHSGAAVDVGDDEVILLGMLRQECLQLIRWARVRKGAPCVHVGYDNGFGWIENFGGFPHEVNPAEDDDIGFCLGGLDAQAQRVTDEICAVLYLLDLVIVSQNDCVSLPLQPQYIGYNVGPVGFQERGKFGGVLCSGRLGNELAKDEW